MNHHQKVKNMIKKLIISISKTSSKLLILPATRYIAHNIITMIKLSLLFIFAAVLSVKCHPTPECNKQLTCQHHQSGQNTYVQEVDQARIMEEKYRQEMELAKQQEAQRQREREEQYRREMEQARDYMQLKNQMEFNEQQLKTQQSQDEYRLKIDHDINAKSAQGQGYDETC